MNTKSIKIKQISFGETYPIRQIVLRPNRPLETCFFDGDELKTTFHFGSFVNDNLVGIISLFKNDNPLFQKESQYQIRGMAVLEEYREYGFGKMLIAHSEKFLAEKDINFVWFNARETAVNFYKKQGCKIIGDAFDIPDAGIHYVMWKER